MIGRPCAIWLQSESAGCSCTAATHACDNEITTGLHVRRPNVWPHEHLPELQPAFEALGRRVVEAGLKVAALCDLYVQSKVRTHCSSLLLAL